ncbi:hypothetical protein CFIMG_002830RAa [Ceratocystis fimbriata CBS 114723]|uniref:F-box domain-containing protein n=1 Tax=Ceratocystis fimbriata CBS 114723 TaxID=1035309 RepID=A0A2C5X9L1_9PEZI|nr:hypothetical protein CFIMG_002830RAa [Ceratocystis fimbriata CBS 114723]
MSQSKNVPPDLLELLPPEILLAILVLLGHRERRALVYASPLAHAVYLANRRFLLQDYLESYFGSVMADVHVVYQLQMLQPCRSGHESAASGQYRMAAMHDIMNSYADNLALRDRHSGCWHQQRRGCYTAAYPRLSVAESTGMLSFFRSFVLPVRSRCIEWAIARMPRRVRKPCIMDGRNGLSSTEAMRTTRAVYRFQILSLLAGREPYDIACRELVAFFLDAIEPWEIAELVTVYSFASVIYRDVLSVFKRELAHRLPGLQITGTEGQQAVCERLVLCGLVPLRTVLLDTKDHSQLVPLLAAGSGWGWGISSSVPVWDSSRGMGLFRDRFPESLRTLARPKQAICREEMNAQRCAFPFRGDGKPDAAPLAWTALWGDTYSNVSAWRVPLMLKIWGWAFWDAHTLEATGLLREMRDEWQRRWGSVDPRDVV